MITERVVRRFAAWLTGVTAAGLLLRAYRLADYLPTRDDYLTVLTADRYLATGQPNPIMSFHPVLRNFLTEMSLEVLGRGAFGAKFFSVLFGTLLITAVGLFVRSAVRDDRVALLSALFVALDPLIINYSRQGIQEVYAAFFAVLGTWLALRAVRCLQREGDMRADRRAMWLLVLTGLVFGMGLASKAYVVLPMAVSFVLLAKVALRHRSGPNMLVIACSFVVIPVTLYIATYLPWFGRGYDFVEWLRFQLGVFKAMTLHDKPAVGFFANNRPGMWFLASFYTYGDFALTPAGPQLAIAVGNPATWLLVIPAAAYSLGQAIRKRGGWLLTVYFLAAYLPLAFSPRPIWVLSAVSVVPFAMPLVASLAVAAWDRWGSLVIAPYIAVVLLGSALLYPAATGRALQHQYLKPLVTGLRYEEVFAADR